MSTSAVPKKIKMNSQSSTKKLQSSCSFLLLISSSLLILLAAASLAEAAIDVFNDDECNYNPMRKPPRFGKRSHNGKQQAEVAKWWTTVASQFFYSSQSVNDRNVRMLIVLPLYLSLQWPT